MKFYQLRSCVEELTSHSTVDYQAALQLLKILTDYQISASNRYEKKLAFHQQQFIRMKSTYVAENQLFESLKKMVVNKMVAYEEVHLQSFSN